jgi:uncharacterized protein (TIRG00374 family)
MPEVISQINHKKPLSTASVLKYLGLLSLSSLLLFFAFRNVNLLNIFSEIRKARVFWLLVSVFISLLALVVRAMRWQLLIHSTDKEAPLLPVFYALMIGYLSNLALPRLGEVSRCTVLNRDRSIPVTILLGTVFVERIIDLVSLAICLVLAMVLSFSQIGEFLKHALIEPILVKVHNLFSSGVLAVLFISGLILIGFLVFLFLKKGKHNKLFRLVNGFANGVLSLKKIRRPGLFIGLSVLIWVLYYVAVYVCFFALPFTQGLGWTAALFLLIAGGIGMSAPVQGGIGAYHLLVSQGLIFFGLTKEEGLAFATIVHGLQLLLVVLLGLPSFFLLFQRKEQGTSRKKL